MRNAMLDLIRASNEPTTLALEMARAVLHHLQNLADDEPADEEGRVAPLFICASHSADALVSALNRLTGGKA